jgi:hypothetical protein
MYNALTIDSILQNVDVYAETQKLINIVTVHEQSSLLSESSHHHRLPRKPRKQNRIHNSVLRPHVLASDRLLRWQSPHSILFRHSIANSYPRIDISRAFEVFSSSLDATTRSGYGAGLLRFTQFCDSMAIPEDDRMPASETLLSLFAANAAGRISASTLNTWFAGLRFWHIVNNATWFGGDRLLQMKKGVRKLVPCHHRTPIRSPSCP